MDCAEIMQEASSSGSETGPSASPDSPCRLKETADTPRWRTPSNSARVDWKVSSIPTILRIQDVRVRSHPIFVSRAFPRQKCPSRGVVGRADARRRARRRLDWWRMRYWISTSCRHSSIPRSHECCLRAVSPSQIRRRDVAGAGAGAGAGAVTAGEGQQTTVEAAYGSSALRPSNGFVHIGAPITLPMSMSIPVCTRPPVRSMH
jgi:hypothetical protein